MCSRSGRKGRFQNHETTPGHVIGCDAQTILDQGGGALDFACTKTNRRRLINHAKAPAKKIYPIEHHRDILFFRDLGAVGERVSDQVINLR